MSLSHRIVGSNPQLLFQLCVAETCASFSSHQRRQSPVPQRLSRPPFFHGQSKSQLRSRSSCYLSQGRCGLLTARKPRLCSLSCPLPPSLPVPSGMQHVPMQFSSGMSVPSRMSSRASSPEWPLRINPSNTICGKSGQKCQC